MRDPFDIERAAHRRLPRMIVDFIAGGTGAETGEIRNRAALDAVTLQARALVNVETVSLETELLGERWRRPYGIAPMGMCDVVWPGADAALSAEAAARCMPHAVSTAASTPLEQTFADAGGNAWFQLYAGEDDALTFEFVSRARDAGYRMLLFTVDTPRHSRRTRDLENGFAVPFRWSPRTLADVLTHPRWALAMLQNGTPRPMNYETSPTCRAFARYESRGRSDWAFLDRLRAAWPGKLAIKGVHHPDDAKWMIAAGVDAIYVSNHGARQLDATRGSIDILTDLRNAVGNDTPLIFDSGIRSADDVVRAYVRGASFVMLGRPLLYALGAGGPRRLATMLDMLDEDIRSVMAQIGALRTADLPDRGGAC